MCCLTYCCFWLLPNSNSNPFLRAISKPTATVYIHENTQCGSLPLKKGGLSLPRQVHSLLLMPQRGWSQPTIAWVRRWTKTHCLYQIKQKWRLQALGALSVHYTLACGLKAILRTVIEKDCFLQRDQQPAASPRHCRRFPTYNGDGWVPIKGFLARPVKHT